MNSATDPETGIINLDILTTGRSSIMIKRHAEIANNLRSLLDSNESKYKVTTSIEKIVDDYHKMYGKSSLDVNQ